MSASIVFNVALAIAVGGMYWGAMRPPPAALIPPSAPCGRRYGNKYLLCPEQIEAFREDGLALADNVLRDDEVASIETVCEVIYRLPALL